MCIRDSYGQSSKEDIVQIKNPAAAMELQIGQAVLRISNQTDPRLLEQTLKLIEAFSFCGKSKKDDPAVFWLWNLSLIHIYQELDAAGLVKFLKTDKEKEETFTIASIEYNENDDVISETEENGDITSSEYEDEKNPYLPTSETTTNGNDFISQKMCIRDS